MYLPKHVVLIPDGNRRWAAKHNMPLDVAYLRAAERAKELIATAQKLGVKIFTFWAFSSENWSRDSHEVDIIMAIARRYLSDKTFIEEIKAARGGFHHLGRKDRLPSEVRTLIERLEHETVANREYTFNFAFDYGGRDEILRAIAKAAHSGKNVEEMTAEEFGSFLDTEGQDDPDLIIRTSGESRISGLMPWQSCYSELCFVDVLFPDFTPTHLKMAIEDYSRRERRLGR
ncbi:MAG: polyprenyl diphosphate synthase [Dehalococcoidia bacterium]|nr:polyprenyl diphosphate synthase [Dehalococcoidia bacterium]